MQALSVGHALDPWAPLTGVVHSVFRRAVNLLVGGEMWSVLAPELHDAPFGIRVAGAIGPVRPGDAVHVRAGHLRVGTLAVDCRSAPRWTPRPWRQPAPGLASRLSVVEQAAAPRAWAGSAGLAARVIDGLRKSEVELIRAVHRCIGCGPGMTPAGDDVLVGVLSVLSSNAAGEEGARLLPRVSAALAPALATTPDVSRHLLAQALRGLSARPLHDLGAAVVEGPAGPRLEDALRVALAIGGTSGADACMGMVAACHFSLPAAKRDAA